MPVGGAPPLPPVPELLLDPDPELLEAALLEAALLLETALLETALLLEAVLAPVPIPPAPPPALLVEVLVSPPALLAEVELGEDDSSALESPPVPSSVPDAQLAAAAATTVPAATRTRETT